MSQKDQIFNHLKRHGHITPLEALNLYGCFRLAARVNDLRDEGHAIETDMIERNGKKLARYRYHSKGIAA
jgi:hypothetical protein